MMLRHLLVAAVCLAFAPCALAQDCISQNDVSPATIDLNKVAAQAMADKDFAKAAKNLSSSLDVEKTNITYLNYGYVLAQMGQCERAVAAYKSVRTATPICEVPTEQIDKILSQYEADLPKLCPGKVAFACKPAGMMVSVDGGEPIRCPERPIELDKGEHKIVGTYGSEKTNYMVNVVGLKTTRVELEIEVTLDPEPLLDGAATASAAGALFSEPTTSGPVEPPTGVSPLAIAGWSAVGLGVASIIGFAVIDLAVLAPDVETLQDLSDANDRAGYDALASDVESMQTVSLALLAAGGALAITGAVLLIVDATSAPSETEPSEDAFLHDPRVDVFVDQNNAGLMFRAEW